MFARRWASPGYELQVRTNGDRDLAGLAGGEISPSSSHLTGLESVTVRAV